MSEANPGLRSDRASKRPGQRCRAFAGSALVAGLLVVAAIASSAQAASVPHRSAGGFGIFAGSTVANHGVRNSRRRAFAATARPSVDEIRRGLGLDALGKDVVATAEQITLRAAEGAALRTSLLRLSKFAGRASVLGLLVSLGLDNGDLSCEQGPLYMRARPVFAQAADVLRRTALAGVGLQPAVVKELADVQARIHKLRTFIARNHVVSECSGPNQVASSTIKMLEPALNAAGARLAARAMKPSKQSCIKAKKFLRDYADLYKRVNRGKQLDRKTKEKLDRLRQTKTITSNDLPGSLMREFPGELKGHTLQEIEELCK